MKLDPRSVMQFSVIAEELSFTRAAQRLGVAQPWLSARLRKLEEQLGFQLLARNNRNVALTERGAEFLQAARAVAAAVDAAETLAVQLKRSNTTGLRLGVGPYSLDLPARRELVGRFAAEHPDIRIELDIGWTAALLERVCAGTLDLAFVTGNIRHEQLESVRLCTLGVDLLMSRCDPLSSKKAIAPEDLSGRTVAVFVRTLNPGLFDEVFAPLAQAGAVLLEVPELSATLFERVDGPGQVIATVLDSEAFAQQPDGRFVRQRLACPMEAPISLVRRRSAATPACQALWNMAFKSFLSTRNTSAAMSSQATSH